MVRRGRVPVATPPGGSRAVRVRVGPSAHAVRVGHRCLPAGAARRRVRPCGASRRRWRRRGQRGQVAAIATILGLLLIVTLLANYLATQLPAQMQVNDSNHVLSVEDQVARLAASFRADSGAQLVGGPLSGPISLGSSGAPPFAAPDGASIGPGAAGSQFTETFAVAGPVSYNGPGNWQAGGNLGSLVSRGTCSESPAGSQSPTTVSCSGATVLTQNFTNGSHFISFSGATVTNLNFTSSYSTIVVAPNGAITMNLYVVGSHDKIFVNTTGATTDHVTIVGNYNTISLPTTGSSTVYLYLVGSYDQIAQASSGATTVTVNAWGEDDGVNATENGAATVSVTYTGFNTLNPTSSNCPYSNLSSSDTVAGSVNGAGAFSVTYNNTGYSGTGTSGIWSETWDKVSGLTCPFFVAVNVPQRSSGAVGASFVVHLQNTYTPAANVAFDQGAVIYAQAGGTPLMLVKPGLNYSHGTLSLWFPQFLGRIGTQAGSGTAVVSARLVSVLNLSLPSAGYSLGGSGVTLAITTAYWGAWWGFFNSTANSTGLRGLASDGCSLVVTSGSPPGCRGLYQFNGPLGKVTLTVPVSTLSGGLKITLATYAVAIP